MIRGNIVGFTGNEDDCRYGDNLILNDEKEYLVSDAYMSIGATRVINRLKKLGVEKPHLAISHAHDDHSAGIRRIINDTYFKPKSLICYDPETLESGLSNKEIRSDYNTLKTIIAEAKRRGISVRFVGNGDKIGIGEINIDVYHNQPAYKGFAADPHGWEFVNDGSLCFWFPDLLYLTTGDAGFWCAQRYDLHPVFIKTGHHGNTAEGDTLKPAQMAKWLYLHGCRYSWDNDTSTKITDFLKTGRRPCIEAGMKNFNCIGDLNFVAQAGTMTIYKGGNHYTYKVPYNGRKALKYATLTVVEDVLDGKYGNNNDRITALLDSGLSPVSVQTHVNKIAKAFGKG